MPSREQLESALRGAHSAGDTNAATQIATALKGFSEPVQQPAEPVDFSAGEMVSNIPGSAVEFGKNIAMPFLHPVETGKAIWNLGSGVVDKFANILTDTLPEGVVVTGNQFNNWLVDQGMPLKKVALNPEDMQFPNEVFADQMGEFIKSRYGSMDAFKQTMEGDPVGVLADASMILTGGGTAAARAPGIVGKFGRGMQKVGKATEPLNLAKGVSKLAASKVIPKTAPVGMYESSAKFSTTFPKAKRTAMAETALEHGIMPTAAGLDKLSGMANKFDTQITALIDDATKAGKTIPKGAIFKHLKALRREMGGTKVGADKNLRQINKAAKTMDVQLKKIGKDRLTPNELQDLKTSAYKDVSFEAKRLRSQAGTESATKAIARGAKESIEGIADVKDLNRELGKLLELKDPLSRSAARIENRNIIGIDAPIKIGTGSAAGGSAGAAAGAGLSILEHPKMKAKLAIKIRQIQDAGKLNLIDHNLLPTLVHYGLLQAGRTAQLPSGDEE